MGNGRNQVSHHPVVAFAQSQQEKASQEANKTTDLTKFSGFFWLLFVFKVIYAKLLGNQKHHFYDKIGAFVLQYRENA